MKMTKQDRRDWSLLIFIIPIGILLMMIVGGIAIRVVPQWRLDIGMGSNLEVGDYAGGVRPALNPLILTPFSWLETYLTPSGDGVAFVPFVVIEPSATSSSTPSSTPESPSPTEPSTTVTVTPPATVLPPTTGGGGGGNGGGGGSNPSPTNPTPTNPTPTNPTPTNPTPTDPRPCEDPNAGNYGGPLPCIYPSTPDASWVLVTPPSELGNVPDGNPGSIPQGSYTVFTLPAPLTVIGSAETNYDLVYYEAEYNSLGYIELDSVVLGISIYADGHEYYVVFNWGSDNNTPETHTNVDYNNLPPDNSNCAEPECDNRAIPTAVLYPDPGGTGILIDVDNAPSSPPPQDYNYIIIIGPTNPSPDAIQVDAIEVVDVSPTP